MNLLHRPSFPSRILDIRVPQDIDGKMFPFETNKLWPEETRNYADVWYLNILKFAPGLDFLWGSFAYTYSFYRRYTFTQQYFSLQALRVLVGRHSTVSFSVTEWIRWNVLLFTTLVTREHHVRYQWCSTATWWLKSHCTSGRAPAGCIKYSICSLVWALSSTGGSNSTRISKLVSKGSTSLFNGGGGYSLVSN